MGRSRRISRRRSGRVSRRRSGRVSRRRVSRRRVSRRRSRKVSRKRMLGGMEGQKRYRGGKPKVFGKNTPIIIKGVFHKHGILKYLGNNATESAKSVRAMFEALRKYENSGKTIDKQKISDALSECIAIDMSYGGSDRIFLKELLDLFGNTGINTGHSLSGLPGPDDPFKLEGDPLGLGDLDPDLLDIDIDSEQRPSSPTPSNPGDDLFMDLQL